MKFRGNAFVLLTLGLFISVVGYGQSASTFADKVFGKGEFHGNFQTDVQYYRPDSIIGAAEVPEKVLMNGFANFIYSNGPLSAGIRYESYENAIQGFPNGYRGSGIPYRYVTYDQGRLAVTAGNFYDQFGNGLIFRAYEERGLGYDNAMDGFRLIYRPAKGVTLKGIIGKQRLYFDKGEGIVRGLDGDVMLNQLIPSLEDKKTQITLGGSFVSKFQEDKSSIYNLPENVGATAGRIDLVHGNFTFNGEYAYKINDPSVENGFIYRPGESLLLQASYSTKGFGLSVGAKRVDNMSFRSDRNATLTEVLINYLPALTRQHTYNLMATLYPYATQPNGEMAVQGELVYKVPKKSALGGKYGMTVLVNYSAVNNIDTLILNDLNTERQGYSSDFFKWGDDIYWRDLNVEITKKFSKKLKSIFTYQYLAYNKDVIEGKSGYGLVYAHVGVADLTYKLAKKHAIRTELQHMYADKDMGDWATVLVEYTYSPHWFVAVMDQYNYGNSDPDLQVHYYFTSVGYTNKSNRFMLSYGRQRAGIFCVGGVCRNVPAANGVTLTVTSSF